MKATGLVRRIDNLGRIIIPKEVRKELKIREGVIDLEKIMEDKKLLFLGEGGRKVIPLFKDEVINGKYSAQIISPILAEGYVIGTIIIISREQNKNFSEMELKSAEIASSFLGNQIEG